MATPRSIQTLFRAPYAMPNDLQITEQGLWIVDQITDRVALVRRDLPPDAEYRVPCLIREIATESSNTSGLTFGGDSLWLAANGSGSGRWRTPRPSDATEGRGEILEVDPVTGATRNRYPVPGGGGTHGLDYDPIEGGSLWLTTLASQTLTRVRIADWSVRHTIPLPHGHAHGVVRDEDDIWVVHKLEWSIVKLDPRDGSERDYIEIPRDQPEVHGLARDGGGLLYCDATTGWIVRVE
jgi:streptogramin lyase